MDGFRLGLEQLMGIDAVDRGLTDHQLSALRTLKITNNEIDVHASCPVCMDEFRLNQKAITLSCSHVFHKSCIVRWLKTRSTCPACRTRVEDEAASNNEQRANAEVERFDPNAHMNARMEVLRNILQGLRELQDDLIAQEAQNNGDQGDTRNNNRRRRNRRTRDVATVHRPITRSQSAIRGDRVSRSTRNAPNVQNNGIGNKRASNRRK